MLTPALAFAPLAMPAEAETPVVEFVVNDEMVKEVLPSRERVIEVLESVGFNAERQALPVASLSGEGASGHGAWPALGGMQSQGPAGSWYSSGAALLLACWSSATSRPTTARPR